MVVVDAEARERVTARLEGDFGELCGMANVTVARLVERIAEALDTGAWEGCGIRSPEHWVTWKCGVSPRRARMLVAIARRWAELPVTMAAFSEGRLSEDQVAVVCRHIPAWADGEVAEFATMATVPQLVRALAKYAWPDTAEPEEVAPVEEERRVGFHFDDDGSWRASVHLPADEGALVESAMGAARNHLADARKADGDTELVTWADALAEMADAYLGGRVAQRAHRDRLTLLHLEAGTDGQPHARLHLGPRLPDSLRRFLTCDGHIKAITETGGVAVNVGRAQQIVPDRTRIVVEHRDGGCRVPGCDRRRRTHVHHILHGRTADPPTPPTWSASVPPTTACTTAAGWASKATPTGPTGWSSPTPTGEDSPATPGPPHPQTPPTGPPAPGSRPSAPL